MYKRILPLVLALSLLLTGCGLLEREYYYLKPHSYSYRTDTEEGALQASSYQDLVNTILLLVEDRQETGRIHIYEKEFLVMWKMLRDARTEVMTQTPAGAYSLSRIIWESNAHGDYWVVDLYLSYRRTEEQEDSIIDASSSNAVYDLIPFALAEKQRCLTVRFARLEQTTKALEEGILAMQTPPDYLPPPYHSDSKIPEEAPLPPLPELPVLPEDGDAPEEQTPWQIRLYPNNENAGIVEIFFW